MRKTVKVFSVIAAIIVLFTACEENFTFPERPIPEGSIIIPVEEITGIPTAVFPFIEIVLSGKVMPENATNKRIVWSIKADGGTGATLERNRLYSETEADRTVTLTATIKNGSGENIDYTQDFNILISTSLAPVTSITGIPQVIDVGEYVLEGIVRPNNASNKEIDWSVRDAGTTGAVIHGNILTTTAAGTAVITATVPYGKLTEDYTQDFAIVVFTEVESIGDIPSAVQVGNYTLEGVVAPSNATNQHITWSVTDAGATGATINGNVLNTTGLGTVTIRATIENGLLDGDYTQDFNITISAVLVAVSGITGIPSTLESGSHALNGIVAPSDASNKNITWSVENPGTTGASISGNVLTTTAAGTVTVRATIGNGLLNGNNYKQDFNIIITAPVIRSVYAVGSSDQKACYWVDGVLVDLHPAGANQSYTTGIVFADNKQYIAGYYSDNSYTNYTCYWVDGTKHDLPNGSGSQGSNYNSTLTFSIAAEGSTVYITGIVGDVYCYWKIEGNGTEVYKALNTPPANTNNTQWWWVWNGYGGFNGRFAVNNGNMYIPFYTRDEDTGIIASYYWDENGAYHSITIPGLSNVIVRSVTVLGGTVYMAGMGMTAQAENIYDFQPFYWAKDSGSCTILNSANNNEDGGWVNSIVVQNGVLWFYGRSPMDAYWNASGSYTELYCDQGEQHRCDTNVVAFSNGTVYISLSWRNDRWDSERYGYAVVGVGGGLTGLTQLNGAVTGIAVQ